MAQAYHFPYNSSDLIQAILATSLLRVDIEAGEVWLHRPSDRRYHGPRRIGVKPNEEGYHRSGILFEGKVRHLFVHKIVWVYANGSIPDDMTVDHIDRNRSNNRLSNLRLLSLANNVREAAVYRPVGDGHWRTKCSDETVRAIVDEFARGGITKTALAKKYGISLPQVGMYISGQRRASVTLMQRSPQHS